MKSIYNKNDNAEIVSRINSLNSHSKALWGKMSVDQMLKHTNQALIVAFGENEIKVNFLMKFLGKMMKEKVFNSEFKKNSPTAKEFIFKDNYDFETVKSELVKNFNRFAEGEQSIKLIEHPFWGKMTPNDWNKLMMNHVDHHLRQFGV